MATLLIVVVPVIGLPGLYAGARSIRRWDDTNDPDYLRDVIHQGVLAFLKLGLVLTMLTTGTIAVVGSLAARRSDADLPGGVWICAVLTVLIAAGFLLADARRRAASR